jgi:pyruvate, orthophosphate dikinase
MIEIPRGALTADEIANDAQFFSFGTNDLTQTTLGMSRDDSGKFLPHYNKIGITKGNPFATLDQSGVGKLMQIAIEGGKKTRPDIKLGICGEHGGDPATIGFCHDIGLTYVSCSPFRVPVARLAAAQAALRAAKKAKASGSAKAKAPAKKAAKAKAVAKVVKVVKAKKSAPKKALKAAKAR